jgi:hypothetical protein
MPCLKIIGSEPRLRSVLRPWPAIQATGGHTVVEFAPNTPSETRAREIYASLVTEYSFTPLDTTVADMPVKAPHELPNDMPEAYEVTFIPQYAGG